MLWRVFYIAVTLTWHLVILMKASATTGEAILGASVEGGGEKDVGDGVSSGDGGLALGGSGASVEPEDVPDLDSYVEDNLMQGDEVGFFRRWHLRSRVKVGL